MSVTSEPYESSLLWFLWYVKQCGGSRPIFSTSHGGQERKVVGGTQQISEGMADRIGKDRVLLRKPIAALNTVNNVTTVQALDGTFYKAKYVILATAPSMQMRIHFNPPLPPLRNQLIQRCPMGSVIKCIVYYKTTFWRQNGLCGSFIIDCLGDDNHPIPFTLDDTKPDGTFPAVIG